MIHYLRNLYLSVCAALLCVYVPTSQAVDLGALSTSSRPGDYFVGRIPLYGASVEELQFGLYMLSSYSQGGRSYNPSDILMQLFHSEKGEYFLQITGPRILTTDSVNMVLSAVSHGKKNERTYNFGAQSRINASSAVSLTALIQSTSEIPETPIARTSPVSTSHTASGTPLNYSTASSDTQQEAIQPLPTPARVKAPTSEVSPPASLSTSSASPSIQPALASVPPTASSTSTAQYANPSTPTVDATSAKGAFAQEALDAEKKLGIKDPSQTVTFVADGTLDHLTAAEDWRLNAALRRSLEQYDAAEQSLKSVENTGAVKSAAQQVAATLTSDTVLPYVPSPAEAILMNFYKALSFWVLGDDDNTAIELRRAEFRTAHAVDRYQTEIEKNKSNDATAKAAVAALDSQSNQQTVGKDELDSSMEDYTAYADAVNPAITYVHALYESRKGDNSDVSEAANLMGRVNGILKGHESVARDLADLNAGNRPCPAQDCIWIISEQGQGPVLKEAAVQLGMNLALPGVTVSTIKVAIPQLVARGKFSQETHATLNGQKIQLHELGNMNRVIRTEFDKRYHAIVTRAVISTTIKTVAKSAAMAAAEKKGGVFGGFAAKLGSDALDAITHADTRTWAQTPGGWSMARIDHATSGTLTMAGVENLPLPPWPALVYLKYAPGQTSGAPIVEILKL